VLGDAAGFARHHIGVAQRVEQRGLAVVDVPITVTTGERGSYRGIVDGVEQAFLDVGCGHALDGVAQFLGDQLRVSASITSVILCIAPCSSAADDIDRALGHAVGEFLDLMASGITTSRTSFSFGSFEAWPFSRWVRRRNDAIERSRTSSALSAVTRVRRPRCLPARLGGGLGRRHRRAAPRSATDLARPSSSSVMSAATPARVPRAARRGPRGGLGLGFAETLLGFEFGLALGFLSRR